MATMAAEQADALKDFQHPIGVEEVCFGVLVPRHVSLGACRVVCVGAWRARQPQGLVRSLPAGTCLPAR
jgi:hypothetical protein